MADKILFYLFLLMFFFTPLATTPTVVAGLLIIAFWILSGKFIKEWRKWLKEEWTMPVLFFIFLHWIGLLWSKDPTFGLKYANETHYWLFTFALATLSFKRYSPVALLNAFLAGLFVISVISLLQSAGVIPIVDGLPSVHKKPITSSLFLAFAVALLSFYFAKSKDLKQRILVLFLMLLFFLTLLACQGRAGYVAFLVLLPFIVYNLVGKKHTLKLLALALLFVGALFMSPMVQKRIDHAISDIKAYQEGNPYTSLGLRFHMWKGAINIFLENPLIGVGTGGYRVAMKKYGLQEINFSHPHNSFLYMASSFGILGIFSLLWLFYAFLKKGWKNRDKIVGYAVFIYGIVIIVGSLTDTQILSFSTAVMFTLLMGIRPEDEKTEV